MNVGMLLFLFLVAVAAIGGLYVIGASSTGASVVDTYGNTTDAATNATQGIVQNVTETGLTVGGGVVLFIGFIVVLVVLIALFMMATKRY
jgi:hypothetical protein